jgi:hypothetical protein
LSISRMDLEKMLDIIYASIQKVTEGKVQL